LSTYVRRPGFCATITKKESLILNAAMVRLMSTMQADSVLKVPRRSIVLLPYLMSVRGLEQRLLANQILLFVNKSLVIRGPSTCDE